MLLPPVGVVPFCLVGAVPEQIVWVPVTILLAITGLTVIFTADEVSLATPDVTYLLNQVVVVKVPGE